MDPDVRAFYWRSAAASRLARAPAGRRPRPPPRGDAQLLYTLERVCDAVAEGEARALGVDDAALVDGLVAMVRGALAR
jgi:hypothetical protein